MVRLKTQPRKHPLIVRSYTLTPAADRLLHRLSQDASDSLGWTVSSSAVMRALLRYVEQQPPAWSSSTLHPLIEQEVNAGVTWGKKK